MKKILLATVAAIPLLAAGMMPASSQDIKQQGQGKQGMSQSQSQGRAGAPEKSAQENRGAARGAAESGTKSSQAAGGQDKAQERTQQRTEGRATGQEQTKEKVNKANSENSRQGQAGPENRSIGQATKGKAQQEPSAGAKSQASEGQNKSNQSNARSQASEGQNKSNQSNAKNQASEGQNKGSARSQASEGQNKGNQNNAKQTNGAQSAPAQTSGQATRPNQPNQPNQANQQNNERPQGNERAQQNGAGENRGGETSGRVTLNQDQRTKIEKTVLSGRDVPRVDRVNFSINVGAEVPREVRVVEVPETLVEINPRWRGYEYFVVRDEIYIVDHSRRIVALVPVRESSGSVETRGSSTVVSDEADIRRMQEVLIEKGFYHGRVDGRLGPETRQALITFQQREGIEASGRLDERTFTALGISGRTEGREGANQNEQRGQAGERQGQQPSSGENKAPAQNSRPSTSGQGGNAPSAGENKAPGQNNRPSASGNNPPSASGQGGTSGQGGNQPSANESKGSGQQGKSTQPQNQSPSAGKAGGTNDDQRRRQ